MSAGEHGRWAVVTPKRRCGAELLWKPILPMLLRQCFPAARYKPECGRHIGDVPGLDFPAPFIGPARLRSDYALYTGQIVLFLQWGRIVTESQYETASGGNPCRKLHLS